MTALSGIEAENLFTITGSSRHPSISFSDPPTGALGWGGECSEERGKLGSGRICISSKCHEKVRFGCFEGIFVIRCASHCFIH